MELRIEDVSLCLDHCRKSPPLPSSLYLQDQSVAEARRLS